MAYRSALRHHRYLLSILTCLALGIGMSGCGDVAPGQSTPLIQDGSGELSTPAATGVSAPTETEQSENSDEAQILEAAQYWVERHAKGPYKDVEAELIEWNAEYARVRVHAMMKVGEMSDWEDYRASLLYEKRNDGWQLSSATEWESPATMARDAEDEASGAYLLKIEVVGKDEAWIIAGGGILFHLKDGELRAVRSEILQRQYTDITMVSKQEGWIVTQRYGASSSRPELLHYIKGEWEIVQMSTDLHEAGIHMTSPGSGWILSKHDSLRYTAGEGAQESGESDGDGDASGTGAGVLGTWKVLPRPEVSQRNNFDRARLQLTADDEGWAVQGPDLLRLKDGEWSIVENPSGANLADIDLVPTQEGQEPVGWIVGDEGTVLRLQGDTWSEVEGAPVSELAAVAAVSEKEAWAVGEEILHYANDTWSRLDNPSGQTLQDVVIDSEGVGWAVGANRTILKLAGGVWTVYKTDP